MTAAHRRGPLPFGGAPCFAFAAGDRAGGDRSKEACGLMRIPQDPVMLLSVVNMKLRDAYGSLDQLCEDMELNRHELEAVLQNIGYHYDEGQNAFIS